MPSETKFINEDTSKHKYFKGYLELWEDEPLKSCLTMEEKVLYCFLANKYNMFLSFGSNDKFMDLNGKTFMIYPEIKIAEDIGLTQSQVSKLLRKLLKFKLIDIINMQKPENRKEEINLYYVNDIPEGDDIDKEAIADVLYKKFELSEARKKSGSIGGKKSVEKRKKEKEIKQLALNKITQNTLLNNLINNLENNEVNQIATNDQAIRLNDSTKSLENVNQIAANNQAICHSNKNILELKEIKEIKDMDVFYNKFNNDNDQSDNNKEKANDHITKDNQSLKSFFGSAPKNVEVPDENDNEDEEIQKIVNDEIEDPWSEDEDNQIKNDIMFLPGINIK